MGKPTVITSREYQTEAQIRRSLGATRWAVGGLDRGGRPRARSLLRREGYRWLSDAGIGTEDRDEALARQRITQRIGGYHAHLVGHDVSEASGA